MDEYNLPLGLDIEKIIQKAGTVKNILTDLNNHAQNLGKSAQQSFNEASQASTSLGKNVLNQATAFGSTTRSIENMKDAMADLKRMSFEEKDTKKIVFYNQEIQKLENQIRQTTNIGKQGFDAMGNRIQAASKQSSNLIGTLQGVGQALGIAFGVTAIITFGKELFNIGVKAEGIERAFSRLGNSKSLEKLRTETRGFVSDLELEKLTVKANNFNIPVEKLGGFLAFASQRAKETGEDVDKLTNNIIDGLGRKSSRIIDNLGISIVDIQQEFKKTGDFTTAVSNLIAREMGSAGIAVDTLADKTNRIGVGWDNAKKSVAGFFVALFNPEIAGNDKISELTTSAQKRLGDLSNKSSVTIGQLISNQEKIVSSLGQKYTKVLNEYDGMFADRSKRRIDDDRKAFGEQLAAAQNVLRNLKDQKLEREKNERIARNILSVTEMEQKVSDLKGEAKNIIPTSAADITKRSAILKQAEEIQKQIDEITGKAQKKRDKADDSAEQKRLQRIRDLNAERVRLENEYNQAKVQAIENVTEKAVKAEEVETENRVNELENRRKLYPELTKQINSLIEELERQSAARILLIKKKGEEDELKARKASQSEIAKVLKEDLGVQIDAINERYDLIRQNAKKAATLTADVERSLAIQQQKEIGDATIKAQDESLKKQQEALLSSIYVRQKKQNESEKAFETKNQIDILTISIEFAEKRLALIASDPTKVKEANDLRKAIQDARNEIEKLSSKQTVDLFEVLGLDKEQITKFTEAGSVIGSTFSDLFNSIAENAQFRIEAIQEQIDILDELINKQEDVVDREKDLLEKGFANNFDAATKQLNLQKQNRLALEKQQQEAQKKQSELQRAALIADTLAQTSNLITASTEIYKVLAKLGPFGIGLAVATIGAMFGSFAVTKANAFKATKLAEGGTIGGKSHAEGGNKYVSLDGQSFMEHERGEEVTKKSSAEKHRNLLKAINADDFSRLSVHDVSIKELLEGTGVMVQQKEHAKEAGQNTYVVNQKTILVNQKNEELEKISKDVARLVKLSEEKKVIYDMGDYVVIEQGNTKTKLYKKPKA